MCKTSHIQTVVIKITNLTSMWCFSTVQGRIDQVNSVLELDSEGQQCARYNALDKWTLQLHSLHQAVINKIA